MNFLLKKQVIYLSFLFQFTPLVAVEERLRLESADILENKLIENESVKFISKNVVFRKGSLILYCDEGRHYENKGLVIEDIIEGDGKEANDYNKVVVNYTGKLEDGSIFDSSLSPGKEPFTFTLGVGSVIKGWDMGVKGMKVGGRRKLTIPPELGYGDRGAGNVIPPGATLIFEVELIEVEIY